MSRKLHLDIETFSECDLKREGLYRYAEHPSTELLVACYAFDDEPVQTWVPSDDPFVPDDLRLHIQRGGEVRAHNAQFERVVLNGTPGQKVDFPRLEIKQMVCTAAKMAAHGLPRALGDAAAALGTHPKNDIGRMDMLQLSKPRTGKVARWTPENAPERFDRLYQYCVDDVEAERGIDRVVPDLSANEQRVYELDQLINERGVAVDLKAVEDAQVLIAEYKAELHARCREWTGLNPSQAAKLADWVRANGYPQLTDLQADTVSHAVRDATCPPGTQQVLRLYSTYNAKAVSKYEAIERSVCADDRLHGMFLFHGANTGRWSSLIVQLQNLFRPVIENPEEAVDCFASRDLDWLRALYPDLDPMKVLASCVRAMLVAGEGKLLQSLDYSGIESRMTAWLFDEEWKLDAFRDFDAGTGEDLYKIAYARAFRLRTADVDKPERQIGKVMELAMGYEGGASAFATMAANYEVDLAEMASRVRQALSQEVVESAEWMWQKFGTKSELPHDVFIACDGLKQLWRAAHPRIKQGWADLRDAARLAVENPGKMYAIPSGKLKLRVKDQWLQMRLPSGRCLHYFRPEVDEDGKVTYMGVDTYTRRWMRTGTYGGKLCLAAGTPVLTEHGWKPIEKCGEFDRLWDGLEWVYSGGLVAQGVRSVVAYAGVDLTPDHEVLTDAGWKTAALAQSEGHPRSAVCLPDRSGLFGQREWQDVVDSPVRLRKEDTCRGGWVNPFERAVPEVLWMQNKSLDLSEQHAPREVEAPDICGVAQHDCPMLESAPSSVAQLRGARDSRLSGVDLLREFSGGHVGQLSPRADAGPRGQQRTVLQDELSMGGLANAIEQYTLQRDGGDAMGAAYGGAGVTEKQRQADDDLLQNQARMVGKRLAATYDLVNAGPRRRFTVRGAGGEVLLVHNCENAAQAASRDLLVNALFNFEAAGIPTVGTVHDEIISEVAGGSLDEARALMCQLPAWAAGLPVAAEGWQARRYRK